MSVVLISEISEKGQVTEPELKVQVGEQVQGFAIYTVSKDSKIITVSSKGVMNKITFNKSSLVLNKTETPDAIEGLLFTAITKVDDNFLVACFNSVDPNNTFIMYQVYNQLFQKLGEA